MKLRKSTRYALYASTELAARGPDEAVTATEVADRYGVPASVMAKVFQELVRAEVAVGTRGQRGGYRLARPAAEITLLEVIDRFESPRGGVSAPGTGPGTAPGERVPWGARRLQRIFGEVDELVRCTYGSISLDTVIRGGVSSAVPLSRRDDGRQGGAGQERISR